MAIRRTLLLAAVALLVWSLGYGPLLPWSPVRPGFQELAGERMTIIYPETMALPEELRDPNALVKQAEAFHHLSAPGKIRATILPDWSTAYRVLPRFARRGIGGITLATGTAIYILPTVAERRQDPVEYVRHELSHAVIHQNHTMLDALRIVEVQWLAEGMAVWFGRQKAYITDEEFRRSAPARDLAAYIDPAQRERLPGPFDMRFAYICWRHFNQFLEARDANTYWHFVHATVKDPPAWRRIFEAHFHEPFEAAISAFAAQVRREAPTASPGSAALPSEPRTRSSQ